MNKREFTVIALGVASFAVGPFASVPGVILGRRLRDRGALAQLGYVLCCIVSLLFAAAFVLGALAGFTFPWWRGFLR